MKRRIFLQNTGITLAGLSVIPLNLRCTAKSPNSLINVGMIGTGSHGTSWNLKNYLKYPDLCRVVAVCDVSMSRAKNAQKLVNDSYKTNDCKVYQDFRELLEDESIDAVQISTPDHWHVPISITFYHFRWYDAFSGGLLTDWGAHYCDTAQLVTGNDTSGPIEIVPAGETLYYDNGVFNTAYQFGLQYKYPDNVTIEVKSGNASIRLEGDEGWVESVNWRGKLSASKDNILDICTVKLWNIV